MRYSFLTVFMLLAVLMKSQNPVIPDLTFSGNGQKMFMIDNFPLSYGHDVKVMSDGKILMSGVYRPGSSGVSFRMVLIKFNPDGSIDPGFGTNGVTSAYMGTANSIGGIRNKILVQPDGKIYLTGYGYSITNDMVICRFLPNGTIDSTFNGTGTLFIDCDGTNTKLDQCLGITQDATGNMYVSGTTATNSGFPPATAFSVAHFDGSGSMMPDFAGDGTQIYQPGSFRGAAHDVAVQPDGKIVVGGYSGLPASLVVIRLNPDGTYDNTFNGNGIKAVDVSGINIANDGYTMILQADGRIVLAGDGFAGATGMYVASVIRLNSDGTLDPTFGGGDGISLLNPSGNNLQCAIYRIIQLPDGRYLTTGNMKNPGNYDFIVMRLLNDGSLDTTFNGNGYYTKDISGLNVDDYSYGIDIQQDGKILVSGNTEIGSGVQTRFSIMRLIPDAVIPAYTPSTPQLICEGSSINYTNASIGTNLTYNWIFEGGTPAFSLDANPIVVYNTSGIYSTTLVVSNGFNSDTLTYSDYINVIAPPAQPGAISGATQLCGAGSTIYSIDPVPNTVSYNWTVEPSEAGTLTPGSLTASFVASVSFSGAFTISINAENNCGTSSSTILNCQVNAAPTVFLLSGPGYYCNGTNGQTLTLSGSQSNTSYELLLNNLPTGNAIVGTGNAISWPNITEEGFYTVSAMNGCILTMAGQVYNTKFFAPAEPVQPLGNTIVCNNETSMYSILPVANAISYEWNLLPANAGTLTAIGIQAEVVWNNAFTGSASLTSYAANECGTSQVSAALPVNVSPVPDPLIVGLNTICQYQDASYYSSLNQGSTYEWYVTGGEIINGSGTNYISIHWNTLGTGTIAVTETSQYGCSSQSAVYNVEVDPCTGITELSVNGEMSVYPNPVQSILTVKLHVKAGNNSQLRLINPLGMIVKSFAVNSGTSMVEVINISSLKCGFYTLQYLTEGKVVSQTKVIKSE